MTYRFSERERLDLLAAAVLDALDGMFSEGELEAGGEATDLYNLAAAVGERHEPSHVHRPGSPVHNDRQDHADELLTELAARADRGSLQRVFAGIRSALEGDQ